MANYLSAPPVCCAYYRDWSEAAHSAEFGGTGEPRFVDVGRVVLKFKSIPPPNGPLAVEALLRGNVVAVGTKVTFIDIGLTVDGFKSLPYRQPGPSVDACSDPCP